MGQEIVYCSQCQTQLRTAHFEKGVAFRLEDLTFCSKCAVLALQILPPEKVQLLLKALAMAKEPSPSKRDSSTRLPQVGNSSKSTQRLAAPRPLQNAGVIGGLVAAGVLVLVALVALGGSEKTPPPAAQPRGAETASPPPRTELAPGPVEPGSTSDRVAARREALARESLRKARAFPLSNPADIVAQLSLFEEAAWDARETPAFDEATRGLETVKARATEFFVGGLATIDEDVRGAAKQEEFGRALDLLQEARKRYSRAEWTTPIDQRIRNVRDQVERLYPALKEKGLAARGKGAQDELRQAIDRLAKWGLPELTQDLESALAAAAPVPRASPEAEGFRVGWEAALSLAIGRDYAAAIRELERATKGLQEGPLRAEALTDLESLRLVASFHQEALQFLSKWPRGNPLPLIYQDEAGRPQTIDGPVIRVNAFEVELGKEKSVVISFGEITAASLAEVSKRRPGPKPATEPRARTLLCLMEGDLAAARRNTAEGDAGIAGKYWSWAQKVRSAGSRESEARALFYTASRESCEHSRALDSLHKYKTLLSDYADTAFVRRNRATIAGRGEGFKEYFFLPGDLIPSGAFAPSKSAKVEACLTSGKDVDAAQASANFVGFQFGALPDTEVRCWVYVGACCAETFTFSVQATDLSGPSPNNPKETVSLAPGGGNSLPVKHGLLYLKKTHALHGGPKEPSRWEWVQIPLSRFTSAGVKTVHLLSAQKGFSVAYALVSSTRQAPPKAEEVKGLVDEWTRRLQGTGGAKPAASEADFKDLFNGKDLSGWRVTKGRVIAKEGMMVFSDPEGQSEFAANTEQSFSDYDLILKLSTDVRGYVEIKIHGWGHIFSSMVDGNNVWREFRATVRGNKVEATLDGTKLEAGKEANLNASSGSIAIYSARGFTLRVKEIRIRALR